MLASGDSSCLAALFVSRRDTTCQFSALCLHGLFSMPHFFLCSRLSTVEEATDGSSSWPRSIRLSSVIVAFSNDCDISLMSLDMAYF